MIVGSGLVAQALGKHRDRLPTDVCVYAAGVSNSACRDEREFEREKARLLETRHSLTNSALLVYFSTCSIEDPESQSSSYVLHKRAMEAIVGKCGLRYLIFRLPQLAGFTPNPHTLLNYLYSRIVRSERFQIWASARRNIIDVDDAASIAIDLMTNEQAHNETINIANVRNYEMGDIVTTMEAAVGRRAIFDTIPRGGSYDIDVDRIRSSMLRTNTVFPSDYLRDKVEKYYGAHVRRES